jgi:L-gulono-1,4-lactone dehydrogenase
VSPSGSDSWFTATSSPDGFAAARVGLGAFGVLARLTLQCVPAFGLRAVERPMPLDAVLEDLDSFAASADHTEFYWFPHTRRVLTKANTRVPLDGLEPLPGWRHRLDDEFLSNTCFEGVNRLTARWPAIIPRVNALSARALTARSYSDRSYRVFTSPRRVVFRELEYALPRAALAGVLRELDGWLARSGELVAFPAEVRFAPAEEAWLATSFGRETAYLAVHQYHRREHARYFDAVEAITTAVGGRPHWGKLHSLDAARLRPRYPRLDDAVAVRDRLDPDGVFGNAYTDRVLGPPPNPRPTEEELR